MGGESKVKARWPSKDHCGYSSKKLASEFWKESGDQMRMQLCRQLVGSWEYMTGQSHIGITSRFLPWDNCVVNWTHTNLSHLDPKGINLRCVKLWDLGVIWLCWLAVPQLCPTWNFPSFLFNLLETYNQGRPWTHPGWLEFLIFLSPPPYYED